MKQYSSNVGDMLKKIPLPCIHKKAGTICYTCWTCGIVYKIWSNFTSYVCGFMYQNIIYKCMGTETFGSPCRLNSMPSNIWPCWILNVADKHLRYFTTMVNSMTVFIYPLFENLKEDPSEDLSSFKEINSMCINRAVNFFVLITRLHLNTGCPKVFSTL